MADRGLTEKIYAKISCTHDLIDRENFEECQFENVTFKEQQKKDFGLEKNVKVY